MSRRKSRKTGECIYCSRVRPITEDHVPPRNLFAKPRPSNLVKVPSCYECHSENKQVAQDDEHFRLMLTLREDTKAHPDVEKILPTVLRSLARPEQVGLTKSLLRRIKNIDIRTRNGLYLGRKTTYDVDLNRLENVARRIAKGLFYFEKGNRIPDTYEVAAYSESGLQMQTDEFKKEVQTNIIRPLMTNAPKALGNRVFSYRVAYTDMDTNASAWLFVFYERVVFLCIILPKERIMHRW